MVVIDSIVFLREKINFLIVMVTVVTLRNNGNCYGSANFHLEHDYHKPIVNSRL